jgi:hypothetical protein
MRKSVYKFVYWKKTRSCWYANVKGVQQYHKDERAAAKAADLILIAQGREPVNVLKRKTHTQ